VGLGTHKGQVGILLSVVGEDFLDLIVEFVVPLFHP